jgi:hypothetical protein
MQKTYRGQTVYARDANKSKETLLMKIATLLIAGSVLVGFPGLAFAQAPAGARMADAAAPCGPLAASVSPTLKGS